MTDWIMQMAMGKRFIFAANRGDWRKDVPECERIDRAFMARANAAGSRYYLPMVLLANRNATGDSDLVVAATAPNGSDFAILCRN